MSDGRDTEGEAIWSRAWYGYLLEVACPACGNRHG